MALIAYLIVLAFAVLILLIGGTQVVLGRFSAGQMLPAMNISKGYLYLVVPISGVFTMLFTIENIIELYQQKDSEISEAHSEQAMTGVD